MEKYKKETTELTEKLPPTTPPKVRGKREHEATVHINSISQESKEVQDLYDKTTQIWTIMEEDEKIQKLDQKHENIMIDIHDLNKHQKEMAILKRMRSVHDMKNLHAE
jgi:hypothetical protein